MPYTVGVCDDEIHRKLESDDKYNNTETHGECTILIARGGENISSVVWTCSFVIVVVTAYINTYYYCQRYLQNARGCRDRRRGVLAFTAALAFVLLVPVSLLTIDGAIGCVPTAMIDGLFETITTPLATLCLYEGVIETRFGCFQLFTSCLTFAFHNSGESGCVFG